MNDLSLLQDFICETAENLEELEKNLLHLETEPGNREILNDIFRSIHTIKGASEYLAMDRIADLSHKLENLLDMLRHGEKEAESTIIMLLIDASDRIGQLVSEIDKTGAESSDIMDLIIRLDALESGKEEKQEEKVKEQNANISSPLPEYEEEYDKELFAIYIEQLEENLGGMVDSLSELMDSDNPSEILNDCLEITKKLRSSANYMGYEKLITIYESWLGSIRGLTEKLEKGGTEPDINQLIRSVISPGIDEILAVFPMIKLYHETNGLREKPCCSKPNEQNKSHEREVELFDEMIDDMFPDNETDNKTDNEDALFVPKTPKETKTNSCVYEEEHDQELFDIFIDQLNENIEELKTQAGLIENANDLSLAIDSCQNIVVRLKSSAGYMGYSELVDYYNQWLERLVNIKEQLATGHEIQVESFTESEIFFAIEGALDFFPPHVRDKQSPANQCIDKSTLTSDINKHETIGQEDSDEYISDKKNPLPDNPGLLGKLSSAFDSKLSMHREDKKGLAIEEMEKELFSFSNPLYEGEMETNNENPLSAADEEDVFTDKKNNTDKDKKPVEDLIVAVEEKMVTEINIPDCSKKDEAEDENIGKENNNIERVSRKSVRVDAEKIDSLMNQVGELVVSRAWFSQLFNELKTLQFDLIQNNTINPREIKQFKNFNFKLSEATASLGRLANELQEGVMKVRMLPIENLFNRYPRLVRDLAQRNGKEVELIISGADTELDKMVIEKISDPLIHIIRNAVDHGIETPEKREISGKPKKGTIILDAYHESNHVVIEITDNGKGIDTKLIRKKVLKEKLLSQDELDHMSERDLCRLILTPGFSTAGKVTHTSGRGVGMDIVKKNIEKLNGIIDIYSITGKETRFRIKIPLTLAIIPALLVKVREELFTIPLSTVEETLKLNNHRISTIEGVEVIKMRNSTLPLVRLANIFRLNTRKENPENSFVVVVNNGIKNVGLIVDKLIGQEEVVIKPLEDYLQEKSGFSGATILGDGRISLILDIYELVNMSLSRQKTHKDKVLASLAE